jgi:hypothetical protein
MLTSNLTAADVEVGDVWDTLDPLREDPERYWETRSALPWN